MRCWLLALVALLGAAVAAAQADFFELRINLGPTKGGSTGPGPGRAKGMPGGFNPGNPGGGGFNPGNPGGGGGFNPGNPFGGGFNPGNPAGGGGFPPMAGRGGGPPNMGQMMQMMMGRGGNVARGPAAATTDDEDDDDPANLHATVVVEVKHWRLLREGVFRIEHKWGHNNIASNEMFTLVKRYKHKPVVDIFHRDVAKKSEKSADDWYALADEALQFGLLKEFDHCMEEMAKLDKDRPETKAYLQVKAAMEKPAAVDSRARFWKSRLGNFEIDESAHYSLLYRKANGTGTGTAKRWLDQLERNYQAFFDWFAFHGKAMPVPAAKLVVILVQKPDEFESLSDGFGSPIPEADGFLARRDNLAIFSAEPLDKAYTALAKISDPMWTDGWNQSSLLKGKGKRGATLDESILAQEKALALTVMQEKREIATVSSEGTRQLAAAVGLLPRDVKVPQWFVFGLGSFFETSEDAFWPGTGAPSWTYLKLFKKWQQGEKLEKPEIALRQVVTDAYFRLPRKDKDKALTQARTMSWALTYFLMRTKLEGVLRFCGELRGLPRDMDLDPSLVMGCFARAFDLSDAAHPDLASPARTLERANDWYDYMKSKVQMPYPEASVELEPKKKEGGQPNRGGRPSFGPPGFPGGGFPGAGGGFRRPGT